MMDAALWAEFALVAAAAAAGGFAVGRAARRRVLPAEAGAGQPAPPPAAMAGLLRDLAAGPAILDITAAGQGDPEAEDVRHESIGRCAPLSLGPDGLLCELSAPAAPDDIRPGARVLCFFPPRRLDGRRVNAFSSVIAAVDSVAEPPRVLLSPPRGALTVVRRRHKRKRVSDQRFVRVRLWLAAPTATRPHFPTAAPDVWVNAYDGRHGEDNAVTDISAGGLALEVRAGLLPAALAPGSPVVIKCSLFQFREKQFKPYWYAGVVRGLSAGPTDRVDRADGTGRGGPLTRVAVGFTHVGAPNDDAPQGVAWTAREPQQGDDT